MKQIDTATDLIDALGGNQPVLRMTKVSAQAVSNWRAANHIPAKFYPIFHKQMRKLHITAPFSLFGMIDPDA